MLIFFFLFDCFTARIMDTIIIFDRHSRVNLNKTQCKFRKKLYSIKFGKYHFELRLQTTFFFLNHDFIFFFFKFALFYVVLCLCLYILKTIKTSCRHDRLFIFSLFFISNPDTVCRIVDIQCSLIVDQYRGRRFLIAEPC